MIYTIYYGCGTAELCTKSRKWEERFYHLASQCFGIRKNILCCELIKKERGYPQKLDDEECERLSFMGDVYIWRKDGWRKQIEPIGWNDKELTYDELSKWKYTEERAPRADLYDTDEEAKKLIPLGCRSCRKYRPDARYKGIIGMCEETSKTTQVGMICGSYERGRQKWLQGEEVEEE